MHVEHDQDGEFDLHVSREELGTINNALNEVCNGADIDDWEFQTRLGVTRDRARALLESVHAALG